MVAKAIENTAPMTVNVTYQMNTKNQSFIDMYHWLRFKGITNNKFFLVLYDSDLLNVDPRDPRLNLYMKRKVLAECMRNFWYFIREVVRIPVEGGEVGGGMYYKLSRANLALNYGFILNWSMFLEQPRQTGKSISTICYYLWQFLFFARNAKMLFLNKKLDDSKLNLERLIQIRQALPEYLRLDAFYNKDGSKKVQKAKAVSLTNYANNNVINTAPSARTKALAQSLARGMTVQFIWYDEYGFIPYNYIIYQTAAPAYSTASRNAAMNGGNYGILITTTPGDMLTQEGKEAFDTKEMATPFSEMWYNMTPKELEELKQSNHKSNFIYIRFTYRELGYTDEYFNEMVKLLKSDWPAIRREVLLEWSESAENSPFEKQDLDIIKKMVRKPIRQMWIGKPIYIFNVYKDGLFFKYPPLIGVDVAGGLERDSSAITIIDTETTEVLATFNSNTIQIPELAELLYILVKKYMPNGLINIENNGIGGALLSTLIINHPDIKANLYYEIKDKVIEERYEGAMVNKVTKKRKVYGTREDKQTRKLLTEELLADRVRYHKDKFKAEILYKELSQLEVKKNGRIEHSANGHDDQVFSYLMALYVWYYGKNIKENWHIDKKTLTIDDEFEVDESIESASGGGITNIITEIVTDEEQGELISEQLKMINDKVVFHGDFLARQEKEDEKVLRNLLRDDPLARKSYAEKYHEDPTEFLDFGNYNMVEDIDRIMFGEDEEKPINVLQKQFDSIRNLR